MGKIRKIPQRICVGCHKTRDKKELIRIVRTPDLQVKLDATGKLSGRGAYLCRDLGCLDLAMAGKKLQRALHVDLPPEVVENLRAQLASGSPV
jgi:hypothetical protein